MLNPKHPKQAGEGRLAPPLAVISLNFVTFNEK